MNRQTCIVTHVPKTALLILVAGALWMSACGTRTCPPGTMQNATGDCVVVNIQSDGDRDSILTDIDPVDIDDQIADGDGAENSEGDQEPPTCTQDSACRIGELCFFDVDSGLCVPKCTQSADCYPYGGDFICNTEGRCIIPGEGCQKDTDCQIGDLCHAEATAQGVCMIPCEDDVMCQALSPALECRANNLCAPPSAGNCVEDGDCHFDQVCHPAMAGGTCAEACGEEGLTCPLYFICSGQNRCVRDPEHPSCDTSAQCQSGMVCHQLAMDGGVCAPVCTDDEDCQGSVRDDLFCNSLQRCAPEPVGSGCRDNGDCPLHTICHRSLGEGGECHLPCASTAGCASLGDALICANDGQCKAGSGGVCGSDADCEIATVCHHIDTETDSGVCSAACGSGDDCDALGENLFCNSESRCVPLGDGGCDDNADCPLNTVCHADILAGNQQGLCAAPCNGDAWCVSLGGDAYFCNAMYQCRDGSAVTGCTVERDCPLGEVCHAQAVAEGMCALACTVTADCASLGDNLFCNGEQRCAPVQVQSCTGDTDCSGEDVCHPELGNGGMCLPLCTASDQCPDDPAPTFCNTEGRCRLTDGSGCYYDTDCPINTVCHTNAVAGGICSAVCSSDSDCNVIGPGLYCNAQQRCVRDVQTDGDIDDVDEETDCVVLQPGETFAVDLRKTTLQLAFTYNGHPYLDPSGISTVYLRDVESGDQFSVAVPQDGSAIPPLSVLRGTYDVVFRNHLYQTATVYEDLVLDGESQSITIPLPLVRIDVSLQLNGAAYPTLPSERQGELVLLDTRTKREHPIHETLGDGDNDFTMYAFDSTYDVIFRGWLADQKDAWQQVTLLNDIRISGNRELPFDLETAVLSGDLTWHGGDMPDDTDVLGWLWLINPLTLDRSPFWEIDSPGAHSFSRPVVKDTYILAYRPNLADAYPESFNDDAPACLNALTGDVSIVSDTSLDPDIDLAHLTGSVTYRGGVMPDHEYMHRGFVLAIDPLTEAICPIADLGSNGPAVLDTWIGQGTYDLQFIGPLIDSERLAPITYPSMNRRQILVEDFVVTGDGDHVIDMPALRLTGNLYVDGTAFSYYETGQEYISMRQQGTYDDVPVLDLTGWTGPGFIIDLFEGKYDVRFAGTMFTNNKDVTFKAVDEIDLVEDTNRDIEVFFRDVGFVVTVNSVPLRQLLDEEVYSKVQMNCTERKVYFGTQESVAVDMENLISLKRPDSTYDFIIQLYYDDDNYIAVPMFRNEVITEDTVLNVNVPVNTYRVNITLNGEPLSDDSANANRLQMTMRNVSDYYRNSRWDAGSRGPAEGIFLAQPGEYNVYLSTSGSSDLFDYSQWKSLGCVQLNP